MHVLQIAAGLVTEMHAWRDSTNAILETEAQEYVQQQQQKLEATFHEHKDGWQQEAYAKIAAANDLAARYAGLDLTCNLVLTCVLADKVHSVCCVLICCMLIA